MKKMGVLLALSLVVLGGFSARAESLIELRAGAGLVGSNPDDLNDKLQGSGMDFSSVDNYNLDVFFNLPLIGLGVRNEWLNDKQSGSGQDLEINVNNLTLLADLRLLDNDLFYIGPIVGIGYPWGDIKGSGGKVSLDKSQFSYSLAGEAGVKLGRFILAAEAGYSSLVLDTEDDTAKVDLSGFYGKVMVGIGIF
ncbi:MAG: outer membrane beta-barrel protein [Elusimicrobia bacterium]|nr:outer membrane beta-barrel protein [Elusimicrobiota bacterium]